MTNPGLGGFVELAADEAEQIQGGAVAPLVAILMVPLVGLVSMAVDLGYVTSSSHETQRAADPAGLAGASYVAVSGSGNRR